MQNHQVHVLVDLIRGLIPAGTPVVLLGDGEFDGTRLQHTLQQAGWSYACRTATSTVALWEGETFRLAVLGACLKPGRLIELQDSELTPCAINCLKINEKRYKGDMSTSIASFLLSPSSEEGSVHADRLHLSPWLCDPGLSRHAHRMARAPSPHILLAHLHASRAPGAQNVGRD